MNHFSLRSLCRRLASRAGARVLVLALATLAVLGMSFSPAQAQSSPAHASPLRVELSVVKRAVVLDKERWVPAKEVKPGDVIEYRAVYRNISDKDLHNIKAVLPVPESGAYVLASAQPADAMASIDRKNFSAMPLTQRITDANGKTIEQAVPAEQYRAIRWTIDSLPAKASREVSLRVHVFKTGPAALQ